MTFYVSHLHGHGEPGRPHFPFDALLDELAFATDEHPDVSVKHESERCLSILAGWRVVYENVETADPPRHLRTDDRAHVLRLLRTLSEGRLDELEREPWRPGYGT